MIKNFNQFNESFKEIEEKYHRDIDLEIQKNFSPIMEFAHNIREIIFKFEDESGDDYEFNSGAFIQGGDDIYFNIDFDKNQIEFDSRVSSPERYIETLDEIFDDDEYVYLLIGMNGRKTRKQLVDQIKLMYPFVKFYEFNSEYDQALEFKISDLK